LRVYVPRETQPHRPTHDGADDRNTRAGGDAVPGLDAAGFPVQPNPTPDRPDRLQSWFTLLALPIRLSASWPRIRRRLPRAA
jgi:hypothetical protein